jgi:hypothetical protein
MSNTPKKLVIGSMVAAAIVAVMAILDLVLKIPFSGLMIMDITLIIGAALVGYMCWESYKEMT